jgi:ureidoacrylate peracid hydrolase
MTEQMQTFEITPDIAEELTRRRGFLHPYERLSPRQTALVVVDMQNYFMADGEPACAPAARLIVPNVNRLAAKTREHGGLVVWIMTEAKDETPADWANLYECYSPEAKAKRQANLGKHGSGFPLWPKLEVEPNDEAVIKTRYSAFVPGASNLDEVLRARGIDTILVTGVATNVCCESTARDGMMMGYRAVMVSDANAAFTQENHAHALRNFLVTFGDVQTTDEVLVNLDRGGRQSGQARAAE